MMKPSFRQKIRAMSHALTPEMFRGTAELFAPSVPRPSADICTVQRDVFYGAHKRHCLDLFVPRNCDENTPVVLYVHGGGFVQGDKGAAADPFYGNIGAWAAGQAMVGITMNYRLAPDHPWPAGAEDIAAAIAWIASNAAQFGFSSDRIFLMGQSAGAAHVASYVSMPHLHPQGGTLAGAIMLSGIYDIARLAHSQFEAAYYGTVASRFAEQSSLVGLVASEIPCLFSVAEYDGSNFQQQAALLVEAWTTAKGRWPRILYLPDGNHMSGAVGIGSEDDLLSIELAAFIDKFAAHAPELSQTSEAQS